MCYFLACRHVTHLLSPKIFNSFSPWLQVHLSLIYACERCVSKLACLLVTEASPLGNVGLLNTFTLVLQSTHGLWLLPTADQHNEINPLDSYSHIKPALTGVMDSWSSHVAEKITVHTLRAQCVSVCIYSCLCVWISVYVYGRVC